MSESHRGTAGSHPNRSSPIRQLRTSLTNNNNNNNNSNNSNSNSPSNTADYHHHHLNYHHPSSSSSSTSASAEINRNQPNINPIPTPRLNTTTNNNNNYLHHNNPNETPRLVQQQQHHHHHNNHHESNSPAGGGYPGLPRSSSKQMAKQSPSPSQTNPRERNGKPNIQQQQQPPPLGQDEANTITLTTPDPNSQSNNNNNRSRNLTHQASAAPVATPNYYINTSNSNTPTTIHNPTHTNNNLANAAVATPATAANGNASRLPVLPNAKVEPSPAACMYWSKASIHGAKLIKPLRAHTSTLVNDAIWIFGGTDLVGCFKDVWKLDLETLSFSKMKCKGSEEELNTTDDEPNVGGQIKNRHRHNPKDHIPPPCRAHSATNVDGRIFIFGGGDGPNYFDDLYYLDTISLTWTKPRVKGTLPSTRRAHATVLYGNQLIIFGGGNGSRALNDVHALDLSDLNMLEWRELEIKGQPPLNRGYHSANLIGSKCVIFGGSDGGECFSDIHILDLDNLTWIQVDVEYPIARLAHTSTQVGSYLFVIGGHDGEDYTADVKLFNLVTLQWEPRSVKGQLPPRIGYHTATLHDSRLIIIGGFDGRHVFDQVWCLELASSAYLPQVTNFSIPIDDL